MLISDAYRAEQAALHATGNFGLAALDFGSIVADILRQTQASSLLDYGCGSRRSLLQALTLPPDVVYEGYDPAVPEFASSPLPAELVVCIDVLEHVEPDCLPDVLAHLGELCDPFGFFSIHCGAAGKVLSDGRNAHLTQQLPEWWIDRLAPWFEPLDQRPTPGGFCVLVKRRPV